MNEANVDKAIAIMLRAKKRGSVDMTQWQRLKPSQNLSTTEAEFHACGNAACFAGHIALSPEFQDDKGTIDACGMPILCMPYPHTCGFYSVYGEEAVSEWLDITRELSRKFVYSDEDPRTIEVSEGGISKQISYSSFYGKGWVDVTADDVLEKLYALKRGELA